MRLSLIIIMAAGLIGLAAAGYSLAHHYDAASGAFCTLNETFDCDVVNRGPYSEMYGVPVALFGVLGYVFLLAAAAMKWKWREDRMLSGFLVLASAGGFAFSAYLSSIEAFVLDTWCLLCLTSQASIFIILIASLVIALREWRKRRSLVDRVVHPE